MEANFFLRPEQQIKATITPGLKQSIHILQMSNLELSQYLQEQAAENPILEIEWPRKGDVPMAKMAINRTAALSYDSLRYIQARGETLEEWLTSQLRMASLPPLMFHTAKYLAGNLNESGYLTITTAQAAEDLRLTEEFVLNALSRLQSLDPPGIGASNVQECLLLQISSDPQAVPRADEVVRFFLNELAQGKLEFISSQMQTNAAEIKRILDYIRTLEPRPGLAFSPAESEPSVVPDAVIRRGEEGFTLNMNEDHLPRASVLHEYRKWGHRGQEMEAGAFLKDKFLSAKMLLYGMAQRRVTMRRVIEAIAEEQQSFLGKGDSGMKPLTLRAIAEKLGLHESTISRAIRHKYVQTPQGIYAWKYFFSTGLQTDGDSFTSAVTVKAKMKQLIASENKARPLSDQKLAKLLNVEGIFISRRTVSKYREELCISISSARKNQIIYP